MNEFNENYDPTLPIDYKQLTTFNKSGGSEGAAPMELNSQFDTPTVNPWEYFYGNDASTVSVDRANNQSNWSSIWRTAANIGTKAGLTFVSTWPTVFNTLAMKPLQGVAYSAMGKSFMEGFAENSILDETVLAGLSWLDDTATNELFKVYNSQEYYDRPLMGAFTTMGGLSNDVGNALSFMIGGRLVTKALTNLKVGPAIIEKFMAKFPNASPEQVLKLAASGDRATDVIATLVNSIYEAKIEADEAYKTTHDTLYNQMLEDLYSTGTSSLTEDSVKQASNQAGIETGLFNMALLSMTNGYQQYVFRGGYRDQITSQVNKYLAKGMGAKAIDMELKGLKALTAYSGAAAKGFVSEGFVEEGFQQSMQAYQRAYARNETKDGLALGVAKKWADGLSGLAKGITGNSDLMSETETEIAKAMLIGGLVGIGGNMYGRHHENKQDIDINSDAYDVYKFYQDIADPSDILEEEHKGVMKDGVFNTDAATNYVRNAINHNVDMALNEIALVENNPVLAELINQQAINKFAYRIYNNSLGKETTQGILEMLESAEGENFYKANKAAIDESVAIFEQVKADNTTFKKLSNPYTGEYVKQLAYLKATRKAIERIDPTQFNTLEDTVAPSPNTPVDDASAAPIQPVVTQDTQSKIDKLMREKEEVLAKYDEYINLLSTKEGYDKFVEGAKRSRELHTITSPTGLEDHVHNYDAYEKANLEGREVVDNLASEVQMDLSQTRTAKQGQVKAAKKQAKTEAVKQGAQELIANPKQKATGLFNTAKSWIKNKLTQQGNSVPETVDPIDKNKPVESTDNTSGIRTNKPKLFNDLSTLGRVTRQRLPFRDQLRLLVGKAITLEGKLATELVDLQAQLDQAYIDYKAALDKALADKDIESMGNIAATYIMNTGMLISDLMKQAISLYDPLVKNHPAKEFLSELQEIYHTETQKALQALHTLNANNVLADEIEFAEEQMGAPDQIISQLVEIAEKIMVEHKRALDPNNINHDNVVYHYFEFYTNEMGEELANPALEIDDKYIDEKTLELDAIEEHTKRRDDIKEDTRQDILDKLAEFRELLKEAIMAKGQETAKRQLIQNFTFDVIKEAIIKNLGVPPDDEKLASITTMGGLVGFLTLPENAGKFTQESLNGVADVEIKANNFLYAYRAFANQVVAKGLTKNASYVIQSLLDKDLSDFPNIFVDPVNILITLTLDKGFMETLTAAGLDGEFNALKQRLGLDLVNALSRLDGPTLKAYNDAAIAQNTDLASLSTQQQLAEYYVLAMLTASDKPVPTRTEVHMKSITIPGLVGSGKTRTMSSMMNKLSTLFNVVYTTMVPAANQITREAGIKFKHFDSAGSMDTVKAKIATLEPGSVLFIDEAYRMPWQEKVNLLNIAAAHKVQIVLFGDPSQNNNSTLGSMSMTHSIIGPALTATYRTSHPGISQVYRPFMLRRTPVTTVNAFATDEINNYHSATKGSVGFKSREELIKFITTNFKKSNRSKIILVDTKEKEAEYKALLGDTADVRFHKDAQGIEVDEVYVDIEHVNNKDSVAYNSAMYTAIGRAKQFVAFHNPHVTNGKPRNVSQETYDAEYANIKTTYDKSLAELNGMLENIIPTAARQVQPDDAEAGDTTTVPDNVIEPEATAEVTTPITDEKVEPVNEDSTEVETQEDEEIIITEDDELEVDSIEDVDNNAVPQDEILAQEQSHLTNTVDLTYPTNLGAFKPSSNKEMIVLEGKRSNGERIIKLYVLDRNGRFIEAGVLTDDQVNTLGIKPIKTKAELIFKDVEKNQFMSLYGVSEANIKSFSEFGYSFSPLHFTYVNRKDLTVNPPNVTEHIIITFKRDFASNNSNNAQLIGDPTVEYVVVDKALRKELLENHGLFMPLGSTVAKVSFEQTTLTATNAKGATSKGTVYIRQTPRLMVEQDIQGMSELLDTLNGLLVPGTTLNTIRDVLTQFNAGMLQYTEGHDGINPIFELENDFLTNVINTFFVPQNRPVHVTPAFWSMVKKLNFAKAYGGLSPTDATRPSNKALTSAKKIYELIVESELKNNFSEEEKVRIEQQLRRSATIQDLEEIFDITISLQQATATGGASGATLTIKSNSSNISYTVETNRITKTDFYKKFQDEWNELAYGNSAIGNTKTKVLAHAEDGSSSAVTIPRALIGGGISVARFLGKAAKEQGVIEAYRKVIRASKNPDFVKFKEEIIALKQFINSHEPNGRIIGDGFRDLFTFNRDLKSINQLIPILLHVESVGTAKSFTFDPVKGVKFHTELVEGGIDMTTLNLPIFRTLAEASKGKLAENIARVMNDVFQESNTDMLDWNILGTAVSEVKNQAGTIGTRVDKKKVVGNNAYAEERLSPTLDTIQFPKINIGKVQSEAIGDAAIREEWKKILQGVANTLFKNNKNDDPNIRIHIIDNLLRFAYNNNLVTSGNPIEAVLMQSIEELLLTNVLEETDDYATLRAKILALNDGGAIAQFYTDHVEEFTPANLLDELNSSKLNAEDKAVAKKLLNLYRAQSDKPIRIVYLKSNPYIDGMYEPSTNTIYVVKGENKVILHELVHMLTDGMIETDELFAYEVLTLADSVEKKFTEKGMSLPYGIPKASTNKGMQQIRAKEFLAYVLDGRHSAFDTLYTKKEFTTWFTIITDAIKSILSLFTGKTKVSVRRYTAEMVERRLKPIESPITTTTEVTQVEAPLDLSQDNLSALDDYLSDNPFGSFSLRNSFAVLNNETDAGALNDFMHSLFKNPNWTSPNDKYKLLASTIDLVRIEDPYNKVGAFKNIAKILYNSLLTVTERKAIRDSILQVKINVPTFISGDNVDGLPVTQGVTIVSDTKFSVRFIVASNPNKQDVNNIINAGTYEYSKLKKTYTLIEDVNGKERHVVKRNPALHLVDSIIQAHILNNIKESPNLNLDNEAVINYIATYMLYNDFPFIQKNVLVDQTIGKTMLGIVDAVEATHPNKAIAIIQNFLSRNYIDRTVAKLGDEMINKLFGDTPTFWNSSRIVKDLLQTLISGESNNLTRAIGVTQVPINLVLPTLFNTLKSLANSGNNATATLAATLLKPLGISVSYNETTQEFIEQSLLSKRTGFKDTKLDFLLNLIIGATTETSNSVESLGDTNDFYDYISNGNLHLKLYFGFLADAKAAANASMSGTINYQYAYLTAIKMLKHDALKDLLKSDNPKAIIAKYLASKAKKSDTEIAILNMINAKASVAMSATTLPTGVHIYTDQGKLFLSISNNFYANENGINLHSKSPYEILHADKLKVKTFNINSIEQALEILNTEQVNHGVTLQGLVDHLLKFEAIDFLRLLQFNVASLDEKNYLGISIDFDEGGMIEKLYNLRAAGVQGDLRKLFTEELKNVSIVDNKIVYSNLHIFNSWQDFLTSIGVNTDLLSLSSTESVNIDAEMKAVAEIVQKTIDAFNKKFEGREFNTVALTDVRANILSAVTKTKEFKKVLEEFEKLLKLSANGSIKTPSGNKIFRYILSNPLDNRINEGLNKGEFGQLLKGISEVKYYVGAAFKEGNKIPLFKENLSRTISRDFIKGFLERVNNKNSDYIHFLPSQADKNKAAAMEVPIIYSSEELNKHLKLIFTNLKAQKVGTSKTHLPSVTTPSSTFDDFLTDLNEYTDTFINWLQEVAPRQMERVKFTKDQAALYIKNQLIYNYAILDAVTGGVGTFKNDETVIKRLNGLVSPGHSIYTGFGGASKTFNILFISDAMKSMNTLFDDITLQKQLDTVREYFKAQFPNESYDVADGQGLMTESRFEDLQKGIPSSYKTSTIFKPVIWDDAHYIKYSSFVLTSALAAQLGVDTLYSKLQIIEKHFPNTELVFNSGSKRTRPENTVSFEDIFNLVDTPESMARLQTSMRSIDTSSYKLQSNPILGSKRTAMPTQAMYFLNLRPEAKAQAYSAWSELYKLGLEEFNNVKDDSLQDTLLNAISAEHLKVRALIEEGVPGNSPLLFDQTITPYLSDRFRHLYKHTSFEGGQLVLASSIVLDGTNRKLGYKIKGNKFVAEAIVPAANLTVEERNVITKYDSIKNKIKAYERKEVLSDLDKKDMDVLKAQLNKIELPRILGFRIPTTGLHSLVDVEVVGYHKEENKAIFLPYELSLLHGSDYDIDKLSLFKKALINGVALGYEKALTSSEINALSKQQKVVYYKNRVYAAIESAVSDVSNEDHFKHMISPVTTSPLLDYIAENNLTEELNILLPIGKIKMVEAVGIGRTATGVFANAAKLQAYLNNISLDMPIVFKELFNGTPITGINMSYKGNLLLIDAFINSAIDNLKELSLNKLGINNNALSAVSTLLVLGVNSVEEIHKFVVKYKLGEKSLSSLVEDSDYMANYTKEEQENLKELAKLNAELRSLMPLLDLLTNYPTNVEELKEVQTILDDIKTRQIKMAKDPKKSTLLDKLVLSNDHIKSMLDGYDAIVNQVGKDYPTLHPDFNSEIRLFLKHYGLADSEEVLLDLYDYLFTFFLASNVEQSNIKDVLNNVAESWDSIPMKSKGILANKIISYGITDRKKLISLMGKENPLQIALYEAQFSAFPVEFKKDMLKYVLLAGKVNYSSSSLLNIIPTSTVTKLPLFGNKSLLRILRDFDTSLSDTSTLLTKGNLPFLLRIEFAKQITKSLRTIRKTAEDTDAIRALNAQIKDAREKGDDEKVKELEENVREELSNIRAKSYGVESTEDLSKSLDLDEFIRNDLGSKISEFTIKGKKVNGYYDLVVGIDPAISESKVKDLTWTDKRDQLIPEILSHKGSTYVLVHMDGELFNTKGYYQLVSESGDFINKPVNEYDIKTYFKVTEPVIYQRNMVEARTKGVTTKVNYGPAIYVVPEGNVDRTAREIFHLESTSADGVYTYKPANNNKVSYSVKRDFSSVVGVNALIDTLDPYAKDPSEIEFKSTVIDGKTVFRYHNENYDTQEKAREAYTYSRTKAQVKGKYAEAVVRKVLFGENIDLELLMNTLVRDNGLINKDAFYITKSYEWLFKGTYKDYSTGEAVTMTPRQYLLNRLGIDTNEAGEIINGRLVGVRPDGVIDRNVSNRKFSNDALSVVGEFDFLFEHDVKDLDGNTTHVYTLIDAKNSSSIDAQDINTKYLLHYGNNVYGALDNSYKSKAFVQLGLYAMMLKSANPDIQFKDILVLPTHTSNRYIKERNRPNLPLVFTTIANLYKASGKLIPAELLDYNTYDYKPVVVKDAQEQIENVLLKMQQTTAILDATKDFDVNNRTEYRKTLSDLYSKYKDLTQNNMFINTTEGIDAIPMYIGSMGSMSENNIIAFKKRYDAARLKAINRKETLYRQFKTLLDDFLISEGYNTKLIDTGDFSIYEKLYRYEDNKQMSLKSVDEVSSIEAKALIEFLNKTYKETFDVFENDSHNYDPNEDEFISSIEYQNKLLGDDIRWYNGWIPKVAKGQAEFIRDNSGTILSTVREVAKYLYTKYLTYDHERNYERLDNAENMSIVLKYMNENSNNADFITKDLEKQFDYFTSWAIHKQEMEQVYALGKSMQAQLSTSNNPSTKNVSEYLDKHIKLHIKQIKQNEVAASKNLSMTFSATKLAHLLSSFAGSMILSFNFVGGFKNMLQIFFQYAMSTVRPNVSEKFGINEAEKYFSITKEFYTEGMGLAMKAMYSDMRSGIGNPPNDKLMLMFRQLGFSAKYSSLAVNYHRKSLSGSSKYLSKIPTLLYSLPEEVMSMATLYAHMNSIKHNGKSIYDWYEVENGELVWKGGSRGRDVYGNSIEGITADETNKLKYITEKVNGTYREDERSILDYYVLGGLIVAFKRTLFSSFRQHMKGSGYQQNLGNYVERDGTMIWEGNQVEGRWSVLMGMAANMLKLKGYESYAVHNLAPEQKIALIEAGTALLFFLVIGSLAASLMGDDEGTLGGQITSSLKRDLISQVAPIGVLDITPVAFNYMSDFSTSALGTTINGIKAALGMEGAYTKQGYLRGGIHFAKLLPGAKFITQMSQLED